MDAHTTYYVDEDTLPLGRALSAVRDDVLYPGHHRCPITRGAKDAEWLPVVGGHDWILISRDKRLRTRPGEKIKLIDARIRAVILTGSGNLNRWEQLRLIVRFWDQVQDLSARPGPFIYALTSNGVGSQPLRDPRL